MRVYSKWVVESVKPQRDVICSALLEKQRQERISLGPCPPALGWKSGCLRPEAFWRTGKRMRECAQASLGVPGRSLYSFEKNISDRVYPLRITKRPRCEHKRAEYRGDLCSACQSADVHPDGHAHTHVLTDAHLDEPDELDPTDIMKRRKLVHVRTNKDRGVQISLFSPSHYTHTLVCIYNTHAHT